MERSLPSADRGAHGGKEIRCSFGFYEMETMWEAILDKLTERPAASELGRLAQLLKAAGVTPD